MTSENDMDQLTYQWVHSGKVAWLAEKSPFSIGNTSSIRGHFPASHVSLPGGKHYSNWMLHMDGFSVFILFFFSSASLKCQQCCFRIDFA